MVLKMDQRCAYAAKPFVPDLISQPWIGLSSKASDRLWFRREDKNRVESHQFVSHKQNILPPSEVKRRYQPFVQLKISLRNPWEMEYHQYCIRSYLEDPEALLDKLKA